MGNTEILVNHSPYETRVALLEDGVLRDVFLERARKRGIVGNIYKGRVQRVLPGMDACFVDIGLEKAGFLHVKNIANNKDFTIDQLLHEGENLLVQVLKEPIGSKGARLTTDISIPSRFLVYLPRSQDIGVSFKITDEEQRQSLRETMADFSEGQQGGFIVRTAIENADLWAMRADQQYLHRLWADIQNREQVAKAGTLIHAELPLHLKVLRDFVTPQVKRIVIDDAVAHGEMFAFADNFTREVQDLIQLDQGPGLFQRYGIEQEIEHCLHRHVSLQSGGTLIIDQTEAMTTIDVNTAAFVGKSSQHDTIFKTNLEAAQAIARQLRLRNLGGIIMIDFIDMDSEEQRQQIFNALDAALASDKSKYSLSPMSPLGIIEMTRKRTRESLKQTLCETCPRCMGRGYIKTVETLAYQLFRDLMHQGRGGAPLTVTAGPELVDFITDEEGSALEDLSQLLERPIRLQRLVDFPQGQYQVKVGE